MLLNKRKKRDQVKETLQKTNLKVYADESADILARVNKGIQKGEAVKEAANKLKDRRESFDDYARFKQMTGDGNDRNNMYLLWKLGALGNVEQHKEDLQESLILLIKQVLVH